MASPSFNIPFSPKDIQCLHYRAQEDSASESPVTPLIFTHGAGGTMNADAILNFSTGFAKLLPITCFQGNMNLGSRTKMFTAVTSHLNTAACLGGRSMGARAAVMAASADTKMLILGSYPLHTAKETRDQIFLDIEPSIDVLFIVGDRDDMCELSQLEKVRRKMKAKTWMVVIVGADHGLGMRPRSATDEVGVRSGEVAAEWVKDRDEQQREGRIWWDEGVKWSGWTQERQDEEKDEPAKAVAKQVQGSGKVKKSKSKAKNKEPQPMPTKEEAKKIPKKRSKPVSEEKESQGDHISSRTRKRQKV